MLKEGSINIGTGFHYTSLHAFRQNATRGNFENQQYVKPEELIFETCMSSVKRGLDMQESYQEIKKQKVNCPNMPSLFSRFWPVVQKHMNTDIFSSIQHPHQFRDGDSEDWETTVAGNRLAAYLKNYLDNDRMNTKKPDGTPVHHKTRHTLIITGGAGIGKTYFLQQYLKANNMPYLLISSTQTFTGWINNKNISWSKETFNQISQTANLDGLILLFDDFIPHCELNNGSKILNVVDINGTDLDAARSVQPRSMTIHDKYNPVVFGTHRYFKIIICNSLQSCFVNANTIPCDATRQAITRRCCVYNCGTEKLSQKIEDNN